MKNISDKMMKKKAKMNKRWNGADDEEKAGNLL